MCLEHDVKIAQIFRRQAFNTRQVCQILGFNQNLIHTKKKLSSRITDQHAVLRRNFHVAVRLAYTKRAGLNKDRP